MAFLFLFENLNGNLYVLTNGLLMSPVVFAYIIQLCNIIRIVFQFPGIEELDIF